MSGIVAFLVICLCATLVLGLLAWMIAEQLPARDWLGQAVRSGVASALADATKPGGLIEQEVAKVAEDIARKMAAENRRISGPLTPIRFVWQMTLYMMRTDPTMNSADARERSIAALRSFLRDEKIRFGNRAYAWDQDAAETLAREMETEHWEQAR